MFNFNSKRYINVYKNHATEHRLHVYFKTKTPKISSSVSEPSQLRRVNTNYTLY